MFSCEFSKTFITNSSAWSFLATLLSIHIAIFSDSFIFGKATSSQFLRVTFFKVSQELLFRSSSFFRADAFFEELLFQNSHFFPAFFSQNIYLFRAKLLPRNQTLRTGNSLVQLPFRTATHRRHLQKSYFFEADSSAQHQLFQKKQDFEKGYFFRKAKFRITYFFRRATFLMPSHQSLHSIAAIFSEELLFYNIPFQKSYCFTGILLFHSYTSY